MQEMQRTSATLGGRPCVPARESPHISTACASTPAALSSIGMSAPMAVRCGIGFEAHFTKQLLLEKCPHDARKASAVSQCSKVDSHNGSIASWHRVGMSRQSAVPNVTVALCGDSLMQELSIVTSCITSSNHGIVHDGNFLFLGAVPPEPLLSAHLSRLIQPGQLHLFSFGIWYNWSPSERAATAVTADWMAHHVVEMNCTSLFAYHAMRDARHFDPRIYSFERRRCPGSLGSRAYRSDLMRFDAAVRRIAQDRGVPWHSIVWWSIAAQHYPLRGGLFDESARSLMYGRGWPQLPFGGDAGRQGCVPLRSDKTQQLAWQRNAVANEVLDGDGLNALYRLPYARMDTWGTDARHYDQHSETRNLRDCTHFCIHSDAVWDWLVQFESVLCRYAAISGVHSRGRES